MKNKVSVPIPVTHLWMQGWVNMISLIYSLWKSHVRELALCVSSAPGPPTSTARCCLHASCGSCQSHALWHTNCHGDMCVTASESLFIGVRHAVRPAWSACDRALIKGPQDSKIDTTHTQSLSLSLACSLACVQFLTSVVFVTWCD